SVRWPQSRDDTLYAGCRRFPYGPQRARPHSSPTTSPPGFHLPWRYDAAGVLDNIRPWASPLRRGRAAASHAVGPPQNRQWTWGWSNWEAHGGRGMPERQSSGSRQREEVVQGPDSGAPSPFRSGLPHRQADFAPCPGACQAIYSFFATLLYIHI